MDDQLREAVWRIIQLTTYQYSEGDNEQVWGHDTDMGTKKELIDQGVEILNSLGSKYEAIPPQPQLTWQIEVTR